MCMCGADAKRVHQLLVEGVPPRDGEAQPVLHLLAGHNAVRVVVMECQALPGPALMAYVFDLVHVPQTHGLLLCVIALGRKCSVLKPW